MRGGVLIAVVLAGGFVVACASLEGLSGPEAALTGDPEAGTDDAGPPTLDGALPDAARDDASGGCGIGKKRCGDFCVSLTDPNFGCDDISCTPCNGINASAVSCAVGADGGIVCRLTCAPFFDDCDGKPENGCETGLGANGNCGECGHTCPTAQPICVGTTGDAGACSATCTPPPLKDCGDGCVNVSSDPNNCGMCGHKCSAPANGSAACAGSQCTIACAALYHQCGGTCVADTSATQCGANCVDCTAMAPANASASCQSGGCVFACKSGFDDCDRDLGPLPSTGCEVDVRTDQKNCGTCNHVCSSTSGGQVQQCCASECTTLPFPGGSCP